MTPNGALPVPKPSVVFQELDDGAVLFCTRSEVYFGLNAAGVTIWNHLSVAGATFESLKRELKHRYPAVPEQELVEDAREFIAALVAADLVDPPARER